jgi:hypothetical protein
MPGFRRTSSSSNKRRACRSGALLNVGFRLLAPEVEYVCLHDVDRVPIEADYRWPDRPMMIISSWTAAAAEGNRRSS